VPEDARLRVIFDNGTESNMLMRSLQRALHKEEAGRRMPVDSSLTSTQRMIGQRGLSMCCEVSLNIR
jgi:hypothetical protein